MDFGKILNQVLSSGGSISERAQQAINIPTEPGVERNAMLSGMGKGAAMTGLLGLLLGTKTGRNIGGKTATAGSVALLGGLAYKAFQKWQQSQGAETQAFGEIKQTHELEPELMEKNSEVLLKAMIMAARADDQIDQREMAQIQQAMQQLSPEQQQSMQATLNEPVNPQSIAELVGNNPALANEVYLASRIVIDEANFQETVYLQQLANALRLDAQLVANLEEQFKASA